VIILSLLRFVIWIFLVVLIIRLVFDWVQMFSRDWRPRGIVLVLAEGAYSVTDPPLRALRRVLPPLRLGAVQLDLAYTALFLIVVVLLSVLPA
jgi:YggT family protein